MLNGIIQTILLTFSMKHIGHALACCLLKMLISKFLKTAKNIKNHVPHVHHSSRAHGPVLSLNQLTRNINVKVVIELY